MRRELVLENNTGGLLHMKEYQYGAVEGVYGHETLLEPFAVKVNFPATIYQDRNRDAFRPSEIVLFVGNREVKESLSPETFTRFVKLVFELRGENTLVVYGIRPRYTDLGRFRGFSFLRGDYDGRPKELILRSRIVTH